MKNSKILLTGGAGYIGSHTLVDLLDLGYQVLVIDNYSNSNPLVFNRIKKISAGLFDIVKIDLLEKESLSESITNFNPDAVIHFAGLKAVGESVINPLEYYENNVVGTINLLQALKKTQCRKVILRYFNPVGAHKSGLIGEDPKGIPNNVMPYVAQVACGTREILPVYGDDYPTKDGTGIRDYIHVCDLAEAHIKAIEWCNKNTGYRCFNIGTGEGYSVLDVIKTFEIESEKKIKYKILPRRTGDISSFYADASRAIKELNWQAKHNLHKMCASHWLWQQKNPKGYL